MLEQLSGWRATSLASTANRSKNRRANTCLRPSVTPVPRCSAGHLSRFFFLGPEEFRLRRHNLFLGFTFWRNCYGVASDMSMTSSYPPADGWCRACGLKWYRVEGAQRCPRCHPKQDKDVRCSCGQVLLTDSEFRTGLCVVCSLRVWGEI